MNLYQIEQDLLELYAQIEENGGEITPEIEEKLNITQENFTNKLENYTRFVRVLEGDVALMDSEIERINKLKQTKQNLVNRLELSMLNALKLFGNKDTKKDIWRYDLITFKLSTRQSQSIEILDEDIIPSKFKDYSLSKLSKEEVDTILETVDGPDHILKDTISKTKIKEAIQNGEEVNGAKIKINHSLTIK
jgi:hypothetical protein